MGADDVKATAEPLAGTAALRKRGDDDQTEESENVSGAMNSIVSPRSTYRFGCPETAPGARLARATKYTRAPSSEQPTTPWTAAPAAASAGSVATDTSVSCPLPTSYR